MKAKQIIISGHYYYGGCSEIENNVTFEFSQMLHNELDKQIQGVTFPILVETKNLQKFKVSGPDSMKNLSDFVKECNTDINLDLIIDIHTNASEVTTNNGTETFVSPKTSSKNRNFATNVNTLICDTLKTFNRGVKNSNQSQYRKLAVLDDTNAPAILIELFYANNNSDLEKYNANKKLLSEKLTELIINHLKQL